MLHVQLESEKIIKMMLLRKHKALISSQLNVGFVHVKFRIKILPIHTVIVIDTIMHEDQYAVAL